MRNGPIGLILAVGLASASWMTGCEKPIGTPGTGGTSNTGGNHGSGGNGTGTGGSTSTGGSSGPSCPTATPCGGSVVGTWEVKASCLTLSGDMDVAHGSLGCKSVPVTGSLKVTGSWTAKSDKTYTDHTVTTGSITFPLPKACQSVSSVPVPCDKAAGALQALGWATVTCLDDGSGSGTCNCTATANQTGGLGVISPWAAPSGDYTTSGSGSDAAFNADGTVDYSYCASGTKLTMIPKPTIVPVSGTISLEKADSSGSGGVSGSGGMSGSGGVSGSGGAGGSGGKAGASGSGGATSSGGKGGAGGAPATGGTPGGTGPCDIFAAANNTCVAAHSTVRALLSSYSGSLYKVKRASDSMTKDIGVMSPGGLADSAAQDAFCMGTTCTITIVYDQSGHGNFVEAETTDSSVKGYKGQTASNATQEALMVGGHKVYSLYMKTSQAYWRDGSMSGMPTGNSPQGIYMVTSGKHFGSGCCFDYGNGETSRTYVAGPTMDAVNFSNCTIWGTGAGSGPWVMADLEGGLYVKGSSGQNTQVPTLTYTYVTAMEKNNGTGTFAIKGADATTGALSTFYSGAVPPGYSPGKKQGSIVLGSGGDCCYSNNTASQGTFYEGAIVAGYPSDATDVAIQANIVSAGYGK